MGSSRKDYHPKMCISSLRTGECFSENCRFNHIKGTKRQPPVIKRNALTRDQPTHANENGNTKNEADHFLEMIRLLKAEILQTIDQKITSITTQIIPPQNQQIQMPNLMPMFPNLISPQTNMPMMGHQPPQMMFLNQQPNRPMMVNPNQQPNRPSMTNQNQQTNRPTMTNPNQQLNRPTMSNQNQQPNRPMMSNPNQH